MLKIFTPELQKASEEIWSAADDACLSCWSAEELVEIIGLQCPSPFGHYFAFVLPVGFSSDAFSLMKNAAAAARESVRTREWLDEAGYGTDHDEALFVQMVFESRDPGLAFYRCPLCEAIFELKEEMVPEIPRATCAAKGKVVTLDKLKTAHRRGHIGSSFNHINADMLHPLVGRA